MNKIYKFQSGGKPTRTERFNNFLGKNTWGNAIGAGVDLLGSFINEPPGYQGKEGALQVGLDQTYGAVSDAVGNIPVFGKIASFAMKAAGVLNKGLQRLGGGTDGMTKADAILNSNFLGLTPLGLINGFFGKKADSYTRNAQLDAQSGAGFSGFQQLQNTTQVGAGKKYGLFSSGAREKQNELTKYTQDIKHSVSGIVNTNTINNLAAESSSPFSIARFQMDINGGPQRLIAARKGAKIPKPQKPFMWKHPYVYNDFKATLGEDWQVVYDPQGIQTAIPSVLSASQKQGIAPIPTKRGTIVYMGADGKLRNKPVSYSLRNGGQFVKNVITKYQQGSSLRRFVQLFDVSSGKYVQVPIPLSKDQIAGKMPIRLANGTAVFMNSNGTVTSDRWETPVAREHLTPKGKDGIKIKENRWKNKIPYEEWVKDVNPDYISPNYDLETAYRYLPIEDLERWKFAVNSNNPQYFMNFKDDNGRYIYHLGSVAQLPDSDDYIFLKLGKDEQDNPELLGELQSYYDGSNGLKDTHDLVYDPKEQRNFYRRKNKVDAHKNGGKMNVIPEGALHARKNHLTEIDDMYKEVTHKGIPVITVENGEVIQHAEVEHSEIIFTKEVTDKMEQYKKSGTDEAMIECGKMLVKEILYNTDDRSGIMQTVE